jgi:hypothetical protein
LWIIFLKIVLKAAFLLDSRKKGQTYPHIETGDGERLGWVLRYCEYELGSRLGFVHLLVDPVHRQFAQCIDQARNVEIDLG